MRDQGVNLMHGILVHLLRNSMDHGIEKPAERSRLGKLEEGTIYISAKFIDHVLRSTFLNHSAFPLKSNFKSSWRLESPQGLLL